MATRESTMKPGFKTVKKRKERKITVLMEDLFNDSRCTSAAGAETQTDDDPDVTVEQVQSVDVAMPPSVEEPQHVVQAKTGDISYNLKISMCCKIFLTQLLNYIPDNLAFVWNISP
uniref:Uncharacterized protein n=1 Tax=Amphimedon queenslandica TaxID=400682 RepID=A0A1X7UMN2_AMPQE